MDLEDCMLDEIREKQIMYNLTDNMESKRKQTETEKQRKRQSCDCSSRGREAEISEGSMWYNLSVRKTSHRDAKYRIQNIVNNNELYFRRHLKFLSLASPNFFTQV